MACFLEIFTIQNQMQKWFWKIHVVQVIFSVTSVDR